eukprot:9055763-Prorocentrum_lima.AAC.1
MTSSLVGSEMCIRDRDNGHVRNQAWARSQPGPGPWARPQPGPGPQARSPVSYTHLTLPTICSV